MSAIAKGNGYGYGYGDGFPEQNIGGPRSALAAASAREGFNTLALGDLVAFALGRAG